MAEERYQIHLEVFEGPMDLLVYLIRKNEVDIYDIPIAVITDQYLAHLEMMRSLNVDVAGDFLVMAATLMQLKSRMLLPVHGIEEEEDPRMEIVRPLREYLQLADAAERISQRALLGDTVFTRCGEPPPPADPEEGATVRVGLFELVDALQGILARLSGEERFTMRADAVSVKARIQEITDIIEAKKTVAFTELFEDMATRGGVIVTFLAILEMCKHEIIRVVQHAQGGAIRIYLA
jgi:segregation and condensation protein A